MSFKFWIEYGLLKNVINKIWISKWIIVHNFNFQVISHVTILEVKRVFIIYPSFICFRLWNNLLLTIILRMRLLLKRISKRGYCIYQCKLRKIKKMIWVCQRLNTRIQSCTSLIKIILRIYLTHVRLRVHFSNILFSLYSFWTLNLLGH